MIRTSHLPVAILYERYKVNRSMIRNVAYNRFHLPQDYRICFSYLKLLPCSGADFWKHMRDGMYVGYDPISGKTILYSVIYKDCGPAAVKRAMQVNLSFRIAQDDLNIEPLVLVQIAVTESGDVTCL